MEPLMRSLHPAIISFGWVNNETQEVTGVKLPGGLSFLVHQDFDEPITGLNAFPKEDRPGQVMPYFNFIISWFYRHGCS